MARSKTRLAVAVTIAIAATGLISASASALGVTWMQGYVSEGTPAKYNKVGVIKVGPRAAKNVLVLEPGTSAGAAYFVPLAKWIVATVPGWQVWSVERRENLLEDQSVLNLAKQGRASVTQLFNYYLGWLERGAHVARHFQLIPDSSVDYAKHWGMHVAIADLHQVITAAKQLGGKVVLGGHSLGGSVVTAYATWDFSGQPGARDLAGLVYIDGGSGPAVSTQQAVSEIQSLSAASASPWLTFGGITAPFAGLYNATGSLATLLGPNAPSLGQTSGLLPSDLVPPVRVTNLAQYGYALNVKTSPPALIAAQAHLGTGIAAGSVNGVHGWDGAGALTPIPRFATMFSGIGMNSVDGTEWYFPTRLTIDTGAVGNGNANPAQGALDVSATMGHRLPRQLLIYAFGAALGGPRVLDAARALAKQSGIPAGNLTLVNRQSTYAHNDPAGAYPHNVFFAHLVKFLERVG